MCVMFVGSVCVMFVCVCVCVANSLRLNVTIIDA